MRYRLIPLSDKKAWEDELAVIPHVHTHTHWYNEAMQITSQRDIFLYSAQADDFRVICPISPRQINAQDAYDITTPYGFSGFASKGKYEDFFAEWQVHMREQQYVCGHIALNPLLTNDKLYNAESNFAGKKAYYLDLSRSLEEISLGFAHGHSYDLKQWHKKSYQVNKTKNADIIAKFINLYTSFVHRKQAATVYHFSKQAWNILLNSPHTIIISIMNDGELEAAAVFIFYNNIADYFMAASTPSGQIHSKAIIWQAIKLAKENNMRWLHLGCGIQANDSLEQFKARFGASPRKTFALKAIYDMISYHSLCNKYGTNPQQLDGYFPSYWEAHLERN